MTVDLQLSQISFTPLVKPALYLIICNSTKWAIPLVGSGQTQWLKVKYKASYLKWVSEVSSVFFFTFN